MKMNENGIRKSELKETIKRLSGCLTENSISYEYALLEYIVKEIQESDDKDEIDMLNGYADQLLVYAESKIHHKLQAIKDQKECILLVKCLARQL